MDLEAKQALEIKFAPGVGHQGEKKILLAMGSHYGCWAAVLEQS